MDISNLNLNLLRALHALLCNRNVTLASRQIGVSQSSMSISLKQLREFFNDALLVRSQHNIMHLTPLGQTLIIPVREAMELIKGIFTSHAPFEAKRDNRTYHIGMTDLVSFIITPKFAQEVQNAAPHIKFRIHHPRYLTSVQVFESGELDLVVGMYENVPNSLKQQILFIDEAVIVGRKGHPAFENGSISMENFLKYPLIQMALVDHQDDNYIDKYLIQLGYPKRVSIGMGHGIIPLYCLANTDYLTMSIRGVVNNLAMDNQLEVANIPFKVDKYVCRQYWHQKDTEDPAHQWLRSIVKNVGNQLIKL